MEEEDGAYGEASLMPPTVSSPNSRFSMADFLHDPRLAEAALQELHSGRMPVGSPGSRGSSFKQHSVQPHVEELLPPAGVLDDHVAKIMETAENLDEGVQEESEVNCELAQIIIKQLETSRSELDSLAYALSALMAAQQAYTTSLGQSVRSAAHRRRRSTIPAPALTPADAPSPSSSPASTPSTTTATAALLEPPRRSSLEGLCNLPATLLPIHQGLTSALTPVHARLQQLAAEYQRACREVGTQAQAVQRAVDAARGALAAAITAHGDAARSLQATLQQRAAGRLAASPAVDPWAQERRLVQELRSLQRCQDKERSFLRTAFSHARELEMLRGEAVSQVRSCMSDGFLAALTSAQDHIRAAMGGPHPPGSKASAADSTNSQADTSQAAHDPSSTLLDELTRAAETASEATAALAARMADTIQAVSSELFTSPEIVRQGELESWDSTHGRWCPGHAALTRAGFLYVFDVADDGSPGPLSLELNLTRLQFEAGHAPCFNLVCEAQGGLWSVLGMGRSAGKKLSFQAASVEECCEWAIAIREAIAVAWGKQLA